MTGDSRISRLLDILVKQDDSLLPEFYDALRETGQEHVVNILKG